MALAILLLPATYAAILHSHAQSRKPYLLFTQFGLALWTFVMYIILDDALNYFVKIDGSFCSSVADQAACSDVSPPVPSPQTPDAILRRKPMLKWSAGCLADAGYHSHRVSDIRHAHSHGCVLRPPGLHVARVKGTLARYAKEEAVERQTGTSTVLLIDLPKMSPGREGAISRLNATAMLYQPELLVQE